MIVSVDVYSQDIDASLAAFKKALDTGAKDVCLTSNHDWDTKEFMSLNLRFEADHKNEALASLDDGPFQKDSEF
jgi:hypothetical protein